MLKEIKRSEFANRPSMNKFSRKSSISLLSKSNSPVRKPVRYQALQPVQVSVKGLTTAIEKKQSIEQSEIYHIGGYMCVTGPNDNLKYLEYINSKNAYESLLVSKQMMITTKRDSSRGTQINRELKEKDPIILKLLKLNKAKKQPKVCQKLRPINGNTFLSLIRRLRVTKKIKNWTSILKASFKVRYKGLDIFHTLDSREQAASLSTFYHGNDLIILHGGLGSETYRDLYLIDVTKEKIVKMSKIFKLS